jgi:hypothetical protein
VTRRTNALLAFLLLLLPTLPLAAQQMADTAFHPHVPAPAFPAGKGPLVVIDEAHHNFHTADGRYLPFATLLRQDGFTVRPGTRRFDAASLRGTRVLVIANAVAAVNDTNWVLPTPSAFEPDEISAVKDWVNSGGALLLIADHMPFGGAAQALARVFGVEMVTGFVLDSATMSSGDFAFRRSDGSLGDHPITRGRTAAERIDSVWTFLGQAFRITSGTPLLTFRTGATALLPDTAFTFTSRTPRRSVRGMLQGAAIPFGKGRVAVFGEAAEFSAQVVMPSGQKAGMNEPRAGQNAQFLLNVMHWLAGKG